MARHHPPYETGQFPCNCGGSNIVLFPGKGHFAEFSPETLIRLVRVADHFRRVSSLTFFSLLGLIADFAPAKAMGGFREKASEMGVAGFGDTETML